MTAKRCFYYLVWIFASLFCVYIILPTQPLAILQTSLDESWRIALQVAYDKNLTFGRDFIFTYGPLGFLSSRMYSPSTCRFVFAYDLFILCQFVLATLFIYKNSSSILSLSLMVGTFYVLSGALYYLDPPIILFIFSTFWLFNDRERPSNILFLLSLIDAILSFYIKVNLGLAAIAQLVLVSLIDMTHSSARKRSFFKIALTVGLLSLTPFIVRVNVLDYLVASLHIANGFNDAMYLDSVDPNYLFYALGTLATLATLVTLNLYFNKSLILAASCAGFAFVLFKQAFVRSDEHIFVFFDYIVIPFALLALFARPRLRILNCAALICAIVLSIYQSRLSYFRITEKQAAVKNYINSFSPLIIHVISSASSLPQAIIDQVNTGSVDLMPDNTSLLFHAGLNYIPRPVIQSYTAYDHYLDAINANYFATRGPDYLVYSHGCIDYRYCLHDETETKISLLQHYDHLFTTENYSLLKKRALPLTLKRTLHKSGKLRFGERLHLTESNSPQLVKFDLDYSLLGKLRRFTYKPFPLKLTVATKTDKQTYRAIVPILKGGVIANLSVNDPAAQSAFLSRDFAKVPKNSFIRINSSHSRHYTKYFNYEIYSLEYQ